MWEIIAIAVVVLIAAVLVFAAARPGTFSVQRTTLDQCGAGQDLSVHRGF